MRNGWLVGLGVWVAAATGCTGVFPPPDGEINREFDFDLGKLGWTAVFADFAESQRSGVGAVGEIAKLPEELDKPGYGYRIAGSNVSDDLQMLLVRKLSVIDGIVPGETYEVRYRVVVASNAPDGCAGIGGAPGEAVILKVGVSAVEPKVAADSQGILRLNVDLGQQNNDGADGEAVDDVSNGIDCATVPDLEDAPYVSLVRFHELSKPVKASSAGELWLIVGTDSGFEGRTELYYEEIEIVLTPVSD